MKKLQKTAETGKTISAFGKIGKMMFLAILFLQSGFSFKRSKISFFQ